MKELKLFAMLCMAVLLASCGEEKNEPAGMTFETYVKQAEVTIPNDGDEWEQHLNLCIDIPKGDGEAEANVTKGILDIIGRSAVANVLGAPAGSTLQEVADNYAKQLTPDFKATFDKRMAAEQYFGTDLILQVSCIFQNEACVVLFVRDDGIDFDTSSRREYVVRLSDGHVMTNDEMCTASEEQLLELARKYADESQQLAQIEVEGKYSLSVGAEGLLFHPDQYWLKEYVIPMEGAGPILTEEGKALLTAAPRYPFAPKAEATKGDLPLYELQGPVRQLKEISEDAVKIYTFDTEGKLVSERYVAESVGMDIDELTYKKTNRDAQGRATERFIFPDDLTSSRESYTYTYNEAGRLAKALYMLGDHTKAMEAYYYDPQGTLYKNNSLATVSGDVYVSLTEKYFAYEYDEHGNWTARRSTLSDDVSKREISYYEDVAQDEEAAAGQEAPAAEVAKAPETGRGDLGIFGLFGPVKECKWKTQWDTRTLFFNTEGQWTDERGRDLFKFFPKRTRNAQGRLTKISDEYDEQRMTFTFNDKGLVVRETTEYLDGGGQTTFEWDDEGNCTKEVNSYADMDGEEKSTNVYTILERDDYNNWTRRKNQNGTIETRTITYYE
jgi:hypothetical protein